MTKARGSIDRRTLLAGVAMASLGGVGCFGPLQAAIDRQHISLSIKTVPADEDDIPVEIARHLEENLSRAGIDVTIQPMTATQLLRDVLVNHEFDLYIGQHPGFFDPDYLYGFTHPQYAAEAGWQNPFGYTNGSKVRDPLEEQRRADDREAALETLQRALMDELPMTVVAFPEESRAVRPDRFTGWDRRSLDHSLGYLTLDRHPEASADGDRDGNILHMGITDRRLSRNYNPFAVEFRERGIITGLLYDRLGRYIDGSIEPWLARDWEWIDSSSPTIRLQLREGLRWHDGRPITAQDVAFTYRFLVDTTMADGEPVVPAPRFRSRSSLVTQATVTGRYEIELTMSASRRDVDRRALTVPIIPAHVWREHTDLTTNLGIDDDPLTEALVWENPQPVGSGPLRFVSAKTDEQLDLTIFEDHFLRDDPTGEALEPFTGELPYKGIRFHYAPSQANLIEALKENQLDALARPLTPQEIPRAEEAADVSLQTERVNAHYHVGFNCRKAPFSDPEFRRAVSRLIDREYVCTELLEGNATPALSPLSPQSGVENRWAPDHERGFIGERHTVERSTARDLFRKAGYEYDENDVLLRET